MGLFHQSGSSSTNESCPDDSLSNPPQVKYSNGMTFHELLEIIAGSATIFTCVVAFLLIFKHATHYSVPKEQRQIIRMIFVPPVFAIVSLIGVFAEKASIYVIPIAGLWEAIGLVSFFLLMSEYISPDPYEREAFFVSAGKTAVWAGAQFSVFQLPLGMFLVLAVTDITQAANRYCQVSDAFRFGHVWTTIINTISTIMAVSGIISVYKATSHIVKPRGALKKLLCFKLVVFITFLQNITFSELISHKALKPTSHMTYLDLTRGLPNTLTCIEMAVMSLLFLYAFRTQEYIYRAGDAGNRVLGMGSGGYQGGPLGIRAYFQAANVFDIFGAMVSAISQKFRAGRSGRKRGGDDFIALNGRPSTDHRADVQLQNGGGYQQQNYPLQNYQQQQQQGYGQQGRLQSQRQNRY